MTYGSLMCDSSLPAAFRSSLGSSVIWPRPACCFDLCCKSSSLRMTQTINPFQTAVTTCIDSLEFDPTNILTRPWMLKVPQSRWGMNLRVHQLFQRLLQADIAPICLSQGQDFVLEISLEWTQWFIPSHAAMQFNPYMGTRMYTHLDQPMNLICITGRLPRQTCCRSMSGTLCDSAPGHQADMERAKNWLRSIWFSYIFLLKTFLSISQANQKCTVNISIDK